MNHSALSKHQLLEASKIRKLEAIEQTRQMPQSQLWFINNRASQPTSSIERACEATGNHLNKKMHQKQRETAGNRIGGSMLPSVVKVNNNSQSAAGRTAEGFNTGGGNAAKAFSYRPTARYGGSTSMHH